MRYTKIPVDTFDKLQINAAIVTTEFDPATGIAGAPVMATTGGLTFASNPTYTDFGDDIDNCPKNTMELKRVESYDPSLSGTAVVMDSTLGKLFAGAADVSTVRGAPQPTTLVRPRYTLNTQDDFRNLYIIGDYSADNGETTGGGLVLHLKNAFNTAGYQWTTSDRGKGNFAFDFHGHTSIAAQDVVPFDLYIIEPASSVNPNMQTTDDEDDTGGY